MNRRMGAVAAGGLLIVALLAWLFWPTAIEGVGESRTARNVETQGPKRKVTRLAAAPAVEEDDDEIPLEEDPRIPVVTKTCKWIVTEERRNVPQWVMMDNLRDRGQRFAPDDIRCLTAAGVTPAILDYAEMYEDHNKGRKGRLRGER